MNIYEQAVMSQSACNLSGLCHALPKIADAIWVEIRANGNGPQTFNNHPVMRLFAEQFMHLTWDRPWDEAYDICEKKAKVAP